MSSLITEGSAQCHYKTCQAQPRTLLRTLFFYLVYFLYCPPERGISPNQLSVICKIINHLQNHHYVVNLYNLTEH